LRAANPKLRLVGLTATPFRTGEGSLCGEDRLFQRIAYNAEIKPLIDAGYLSPVTSKPVDAEQDTSKLHTRNGEFVPREVQDLFDQTAVTKAAVAEIIAKTAQRRSILVFAASVNHAQHVADEIAQQTGEDVGIVTGETSPLERASTLKRFQNSWLRWLINVDVLTTGFDAPNIDAIAVLRATQSPGLFAQICGRGFRLFPGKKDCLVLDFGQNIKRHGPLDATDYGLRQPKRGGNGESDGEAPSKICPNCNEPNALTARECECGLAFPPPPPRHEAGAGNDEILAANEPPRVWECDGPINACLWTNRKTGSRTLRVDYDVQAAGGNMRDVISEWVCLEHDGYAGTKAQQWWAKRCAIPAESIEHACELWEAGAVALPRQITTKKDGRWQRIVDYVLDEAANPDGELSEPQAAPVDAWAMAEDEIPF
jgi:DNA repair protein RadD